MRNRIRNVPLYSDCELHYSTLDTRSRLVFELAEIFDKLRSCAECATPNGVVGVWTRFCHFEEKRYIIVLFFVFSTIFFQFRSNECV